MNYSLEEAPVSDLHALEADWLSLQQSADCSYFQSWGWIGTWLKCVAKDLHPVTLKVWHGKTLVGLGVFIAKKVKRKLLVTSNAMFLNEYPYDGKNMVIEYNGLLTDRKHHENVYKKVIQYLLGEHKNQDEFYFGGVENSDLLLSALGSEDVAVDVREESTSWQVDLSQFDNGLDAFLATLSKNRRWQIRRSIRLYEESGALQFEEASNMRQALEFFNGLKELHANRWQAKGQSGVFSNSLRETFHHALIRDRFANGEIQLIKVSNSLGAIGYLYNYIWGDRVYVLQMGFNITSDNRLRPGYLVHALSIVHNKGKGMAVYDFMHGDSSYKVCFSNKSLKLYWLVMQRRRLKFKLENMAISLVREARQYKRELGKTFGL